MQERYLGDTPDFAKYALLKALCGSDLSLGINWYLTLPHEVDSKDNKDGETRHHVSDPNSYRAVDETLWEQLESFQHSDDRSITALELSKALPSGTQYFSDALSFGGIPSKDGRLQARSDWVQRGLRKLKNTDLVFVDPDTGMEIPSVERHEKAGPKYSFYDELIPLVRRGQALVIIQFVDRSGAEKQARKVAGNLRTRAGFDGELDVVRAKSGRAILFFILHSDKHGDQIKARLDKFLSGPARQRFRRIDEETLAVTVEDIEEQSSVNYLDRISDHENIDADHRDRKRSALENLAIHLLNNSNTPLPLAVVDELHDGFLVYLYAHQDNDDLLKRIPSYLRHFAGKARHHVLKNREFCLDHALGISIPSFEGAPPKKPGDHKHQRLFLMAFHDHEVSEEFPAQIEALRNAARIDGLQAFEEKTLDGEYRDWRDENVEWLTWVFDLA
jgi:hypothetical protein